MIVKNVRSYKPTDVTIIYECGICNIQQSLYIPSNISKYTAFCKVCDAINELEIVVCPECNSSASVIESAIEPAIEFQVENFAIGVSWAGNSKPLTTQYKCITCDRMF